MIYLEKEAEWKYRSEKGLDISEKSYQTFRWWEVSKLTLSDALRCDTSLSFLQLQLVKVINLEYGKLKNGKLESYLVSKNVKTASPKNSNGKLKFSLENGSLEKKTL